MNFVSSVHISIQISRSQRSHLVCLLAPLPRFKTNTAVTTFDSPEPAKKGNSGRLADLFYDKEGIIGPLMDIGK
jgi:hypothetical protein